MFLKILKGKIHRATVSAVDPQYEGSITIDEDIAQAAGIGEFESVLVADCNNGTRHETYVIYGPPGSGVISVNGAAARLVQAGDKVIIMAFGYIHPEELVGQTVRIALMGEGNAITRQIEHTNLRPGRKRDEA
jgi:aspartate 1-decarboxylase